MDAYDATDDVKMTPVGQGERVLAIGKVMRSIITNIPRERYLDPPVGVAVRVASGTQRNILRILCRCKRPLFIQECNWYGTQIADTDTTNGAVNEVIRLRSNRNFINSQD